jgi:hypothetical protein
LAGPKGDQGPQGVQGPRGIQGVTGPQGPQGNAGPAGPAGPASVVAGPPGATGEQGATGPAGAPGTTGIQGPAGPQGPKGDTGATGPQGPAGTGGGGGATPTSDTFDISHFKGVGTYSNNNQTITGGNGNYFTSCSVGSHDLTAGKYYFEFTTNDPTPPGWWDSGVGVGTYDDLSNYIGHQSTALGIFPDGEVYSNNANIATTTPLVWTLGCVIGIAIGNGKLWYRVDNSTWNGDASADPVAGTGGFTVPSAAQYFMAQVCKASTGTTSISVNTVAPFVHAPPTGYSAWGSPPTPAVVPGWQIISKGVLNNVQTFDVRLPEGYASFQFQIVGAKFPIEDQFCIMVSYDNGNTFLSDAVNFNTYSNAGMLLYQSVAGTNVYTNPNR